MELNVENDDDSRVDETTNAEEKVEEPKVGMMFNSNDEICDFYRRYGKQMGFGTCRRSSRKDKNGEVRYVTITCGREGKSRCKSSNPINRHAVPKMECKARVCATICPDGKWVITSVVLQHNHALSPSESRIYRRRNRVILPNVKRRLESNDSLHIRMSKSFNSKIEVRGHESLSVQEDCKDNIARFQCLRLGEGDATAIHNYFLKMQVNNSDFFYVMDFDNEGRLRNLFWADARSRAAGKEFGDVILFDTTYLTDKYEMPLVLFLGANHHGQLVLLGCGVIARGDVDTFKWIFQSFRTCMSGCHPSAIITDQDKAVKNAIEIVFSNARHRWCLCHIMKKLLENLRGHKNYESIKFSIQSAVFDSLTSAEFEETWCKFIMEYNLESDEWLRSLYEERHRWVPIFLKDTFWAGMSTTQRWESMDAFFDGYVNSKTSLKQFLGHYEKALRSKVEKENQEDFNSLNRCLPCMTRYDMEKQFQSTYTTTKFNEFQQELLGKIYCESGFSSCMNGVGIVEYEVSEDVSSGESLRRAIFKVSLDEDAEEVDCNCRLFQFRGILCRHAITALIHRKIYKVPQKYILRRWDKTVKRCHTKIKISYSDWSTKPEARRFDKLCNAFYEVADLATDSEDRCEKVLAWIHNLKEDLTADSCGSNQPGSNKSDDTPSCEIGT